MGLCSTLGWALVSVTTSGGAIFFAFIIMVLNLEPVIPGWSEGPDPESRDSGFALRAPRNDGKEGSHGLLCIPFGKYKRWRALSRRHHRSNPPDFRTSIKSDPWIYVPI